MEEILDFLRNNVDGKTLYTDELTYQLDDGRLIGRYSDQMSFCNLRYSNSRFSMDLFAVSSEMIKERSTDKMIKDLTSSSMFTYNLSKRQSTGKVTGTMFFVSSSILSGPVPAESTASGIYNVVLNNNELSWTEDQMLYRDQPGTDGKMRAITFKAQCRFYVEEGSLNYEHKVECFNVDPDTMERTPSDAKYPVYTSKERK